MNVVKGRECGGQDAEREEYSAEKRWLADGHLGKSDLMLSAGFPANRPYVFEALFLKNRT